MERTWTLSELVAEAVARLEALPPPKNGQVRAVPDERTIRYYAALGLLDRPSAMRGRTALYSARHLAQVVAIKRMQSAGKSLAEIQTVWPTMDDVTLARMSGVHVPKTKGEARKNFWKKEIEAAPVPPPRPVPQARAASPAPATVQVAIAPGITVTIALADDAAITSADVRAFRAAAAPLVAELAKRGLMTPGDGVNPSPSISGAEVGTLEEDL